MKENIKTKGLWNYGFKLGSMVIGTFMMSHLWLKAVGLTNENALTLNWENYDDFNDNSLDASKWDFASWDGGNLPIVSNGKLAFSGKTVSGWNQSIVTQAMLAANSNAASMLAVGSEPHSVLEFKDSNSLKGIELTLNLPSGVPQKMGFGLYAINYAAHFNASTEAVAEAAIRFDIDLWYNSSNPEIEFQVKDPQTGVETDVKVPIQFDQSYRVGFVRDETTIKFYLNDELKVEFPYQNVGETFMIRAMNENDQSFNTYVDNVRVLRNEQGTGSEEDDEKEISELYKRLTEEVAQEENDSRASLLKGIHSLLQIFESDEVNSLKDFVVQLGVESSIRKFSLTDLPLEEDYAFELNRNFNSAKLAELLEDGIIPSLVETESFFAQIPVSSVIILESGFTGAEETITVDYADVLVLRSMVKVLSALASMQTAYDWGLNAGFAEDQDEDDANSTMQTFRTHNPNLLGIRNKEQLAKARQFLEDGIALYQIASPILTDGSRLGYEGQPFPDRLFVIDNDSQEDEREFREDLDDLLDALYEPYHLSSGDEGNSGPVSPQYGYYFEDRDLAGHIGIIDLNQFFEGKVDLAQILPDSSGDRLETYQFRDPTFGGLFPRLNPKRLSTILFEEDLVADQKPHPHDTLTEALTHFDPNAYLALNQDIKAQHGANSGTALEHFKNFGFWENRRYFFWPFESVDFPISLTEPTVVNGQVVLLNGRLLGTGGSNSVRVGFVISSEGLLPRYDLGWEVYQAALNTQNGFSHAYQPMKSNTTYYYRAYAENEAGRWFGSVKRFKSAQLQADQNSLFGQARSIGNGWYESPWFGILNLPVNGWSYHFDLGWIYLPETNQDGIWMWSDRLKGWTWTKSGVWPYLWEHNRANWLYFKKVVSQTHFFNFSSGSYE